MDYRFAGEDAGGNAPRRRRGRITMSKLGKGGRYSSKRDSAQLLAFGNKELAELCPAQSHCFFEHSIEHRREVAGRGIDDPENLRGRGLLFERLARLGDEARVFNRDHRLISEGAHEFRSAVL